MSQGTYYTVYKTIKPYKVTVENGKANIFQLDLINQTYQLVMSERCTRIKVGRIPKELPQGETDRLSLLIQTAPCQYIFVGPMVYTFTTFGDITSYEPSINYEGVAMAYAKDDIGNVYMLTEKVVIRGYNSAVNPYQYYNDNCRVCDVWVDGQRVPMMYDSNAAERFNKLCDADGVLQTERNGVKWSWEKMLMWR